jgi:hypothetical protein
MMNLAGQHGGEPEAGPTCRRARGPRAAWAVHGAAPPGPSGLRVGQDEPCGHCGTWPARMQLGTDEAGGPCAA